MKLIVGLGNHGDEYAGTRHNAGWDAVRVAAKELGASDFKIKKDFKAAIAETNVEGQKVLFALPQTYMNLSGDAVQAIKTFYKLSNEDILIIHDEMDYAPGTIAFAANAGPAGNNGVASVQERLGTKRIARLRIGIGRGTHDSKDWVLSRFSKEDAKAIAARREDMVHAITDWITRGLTQSMNTWNAVKSGN
ncbi:MAG TPA: aminoacyl-tRNA hydrolase [Verrucomicrobiae bacterium]|nr:aminoacyl-tRNA hydrolase [Verrucomicrobiae bacterium]